RRGSAKAAFFRPVLQAFSDFAEQVVGCKRFAQKPRAGGHFLIPEGFLSHVTRNEKDSQILAGGHKLHGKFAAVDRRHGHIGKEQIELVALCERNGVGSIRRRYYRVTSAG